MVKDRVDVVEEPQPEVRRSCLTLCLKDMTRQQTTTTDM